MQENIDIIYILESVMIFNYVQLNDKCILMSISDKKLRMIGHHFFLLVTMFNMPNL